MVSVPVFQTGDVSSILITRSKVKNHTAIIFMHYLVVNEYKILV